MVREPKVSNMRGPVLMSVAVTAMVIAASATLQPAAARPAAAPSTVESSRAFLDRGPALSFLSTRQLAGLKPRPTCRISYFASGCGRIWNFTLFCFVPGPPSRCQAA